MFDIMARPREASGMKKAVFVATAVLALSAAGSVAYLNRHSAPAAEAPAPPPASPGVPVTAGTVTAADMPVLLNAIGTVQAFNNVTIKSRVDGQIVKIAFNEGQDVKAAAFFAPLRARRRARARSRRPCRGAGHTA